MLTGREKIVQIVRIAKCHICLYTSEVKRVILAILISPIDYNFEGGIFLKLYYDLHIHSALSPCADNDMTPNNIVNMSLIKGLDVIAVTDHNSCGNVRAVIEAANERLLVIPGMEVETSEEVHVTCYFKTVDDAEKMWSEVKKNYSGIKNKEEIFGEQLYMDSQDNIIGKEENLLVTATKLSIHEVFSLVSSLGGIAVTAHIDRSSYSVISNLGFIPPELDVKTVEITPKNREKLENDYKNYRILSNSDAHYLEDISEPFYYMEVMSKNDENVFGYLCKME